MDTIIEQQEAKDEALVPHAQRLRIGRSNFCLLSDIKSKESTLQLVDDVLCICPFFKAFLVTSDVPEIYMDMLHICSRVHGQYFDEPPFEEEILAFIRFLGHSAAIKTLTDVNINKLYQPWRSFAAIINKCLTGKSSVYDSLRLSQAQIIKNLGKVQPKADIGIFIGYAPTKKAFRIYNRRTRRIVETIHVDFDELTAMASKQSSSRPALNEMTPATISSGLVQKSSSSTPYVPPSRNDWDLLFQSMFNELLNPPPSVDPQAPEVIAPIAKVIPLVQAESTVDTLMVEKSKLDKDKEGKAVDLSHYR
nr:integrase, catalytic region, zinc finger, CCHC-type, peptidase aspartic, catalytic [Tanacetum cinerariifolium]